MLWSHSSSLRPLLITPTAVLTHRQVSQRAEELLEKSIFSKEDVLYLDIEDIENVPSWLALSFLSPTLFAVMSTREPEGVRSAWFCEVKEALREQKQKEEVFSGTLLRSSGSTGAGKNIIHFPKAHFISAHSVIRRFAFTEQDRWLLNLPLYHVGGLSLFFRAMASGGAVVVPPQPFSLPQVVYEQGVTHLSLVPTQLYRFLHNTEDVKALQSLRAVVIGGAPLPESWHQEALKKEIPIRVAYGTTETASQVTVDGEALDGVEIKLKGEDIWVKTDSLMAGYLRPTDLERPFDEEGFWCTGDRGAFDEKGRLQIAGRKDNMLISGGENIYPEEIEKALMGYEGIEEAVVVGVDSKEYGQRPVAFVKGISDLEGMNSSLVGFLEERLPRFKIPDHFFPWQCVENKGLKVSRHLLGLEARRIANKWH